MLNYRYRGIMRCGLFILGCWVCGSGCLAGELDDFEKDATRRPSSGSSSSSSTHDDADCLEDCASEALGSCLDSACDVFFADEGCGEFLLQPFVEAGAQSWRRIAALKAPIDGVKPRSLGEPMLSFARADISWRDVKGDIDAVDIRAEGGYGNLGVHFATSRYSERSPLDSMSIHQLYGLYRMSFPAKVEVDLGLGVMELRGNARSSKFAGTLPILCHPTEYFGVEFRPAWRDGIADYDLATLLTWRAVSLKAGYRWVQSPNTSLDGPYCGLSARY
jgi:hypothetical protein